jgi:hypothetical protein
MSFLKIQTSFLNNLFLLTILISLIKLSLQEESDIELTKTVKSLRKRANEMKAEYEKYEIPENLSNITDFTQYDNITNIAIFLNKTGITHLKQSVTNQRTSGIKKEYMAKYLDSISKRFEFSDEIKDFFKPMFLKITEIHANSWNNYELMYKKNSTNTTLFVCILTKNYIKEGKVDFIITQVELEYQFSNFLVIKINTSDSTGKESTNYKYIKTDVKRSVTDYQLEAALDILAATGYNSLAKFLNIKDDNLKETENVNLNFLQ